MEDAQQEIIRRHYVFSGRVQGVGFRSRAEYIATRLGLTGWVMNKMDGTVEMEVQGPRHLVERMIPMMSQSDWIYIEDTRWRREEVKPGDTRFTMYPGYF